MRLRPPTSTRRSRAVRYRPCHGRRRHTGGDEQLAGVGVLGCGDPAPPRAVALCCLGLLSLPPRPSVAAASASCRGRLGLLSLPPRPAAAAVPASACCLLPLAACCPHHLVLLSAALTTSCCCLLPPPSWPAAADAAVCCRYCCRMPLLPRAAFVTAFDCHAQGCRFGVLPRQTSWTTPTGFGFVRLSQLPLPRAPDAAAYIVGRFFGPPPPP